MPSYNVDLQTEEGNESKVSVTGTVDGRQVAAVVARASLPKGAAERRKALARALVEAYLASPSRGATPVGITVSL